MLIHRGKEKVQQGGSTRAFLREIEQGEAAIFVDRGFQWDGKKNIWLTRARASYVIGMGPVFELKPRTLLARLTGFMGGIPSGDRCFDDFFSIQTTTPEETWEALTIRVRSLLASSFEDARIVSDGHMVTLWRSGNFGYEAEADIAIEIVSEIVHFGQQLLGRLRALPKAKPLYAKGPWHNRHLPGSVLCFPYSVHISPEFSATGPVLVAKANCTQPLRRFYIRVDNKGTVHGDTRRLPKHVRVSTDLLGPCEIICDGKQVSIKWQTLQTPSTSLNLGCEFISTLICPPKNLYR